MALASGRVIFARKFTLPKLSARIRYTPILGWLVIISVFGAVIHETQASPPGSLKIIDDFVIVPPIKVSDVAPGRSKEFTADASLGRVWVLVNYTAQLIDPARDAVTTFSIVPEGVRVDALDSISVFQSRFMARVDAANDLSIPIAPGTYLRSIEDVMSRMRPMERERFVANIGDALKQKEHWRRGLIKREFQVAPTDFGQIIASLQNIENARVIALQIVVGQGPLPPEVNAMLVERDGSWLYRHRKIAYFVVGMLVVWFLVARLLLGRRPNDLPT